MYKVIRIRIFVASIFSLALLGALILVVVSNNPIHYLLFVSVAFIFWAQWRYLPYKLTSNWIKTTGEISKLKEKTISVPHLYGFWDYYYPEIEFNYKVGEKHYKSNKVFFSKVDIWAWEYKETGEKQHSKDFIWNKWMSEGKLPVYYDSIDPSNSIVVNQPSKDRRNTTKSIFAVSIIIFLAWIILLVLIAK